MKPLQHLLLFLMHLGYLGPFAMGILDSSFLVLPFGNDLVIVGMVARNHKGTVLYVLMAALGSTIGALLLALVSRKLGEEGIRRLAGQKRYDSLKRHMGQHAGVAIAVAGLAPPPFPFTTVIAGAAALKYRLWRLLLVNFCARAVRFTLISILAIEFGKQILGIAKSPPFVWCMAIFIALCLILSAASIAHWVRKPH